MKGEILGKISEKILKCRFFKIERVVCPDFLLSEFFSPVLSPSVSDECGAIFRRLCHCPFICRMRASVFQIESSEAAVCFRVFVFN